MIPAVHLLQGPINNEHYILPWAFASFERRFIDPFTGGSMRYGWILLQLDPQTRLAFGDNKSIMGDTWNSYYRISVTFHCHEQQQHLH